MIAETKNCSQNPECGRAALVTENAAKKMVDLPAHRT
jgi:hypothetical protein